MNTVFSTNGSRSKIIFEGSVKIKSMSFEILNNF